MKNCLNADTRQRQFPWLNSQQILAATASPAAITIPIAPLAIGFFIISCRRVRACFAPGQTSQNLFFVVAGAEAREISFALALIVLIENAILIYLWLKNKGDYIAQNLPTPIDRMNFKSFFTINLMITPPGIIAAIAVRIASII